MREYKARDYICPEENINIYKYVPGTGETEHTHDFIELVYIASGFGHHTVNGVGYQVERGDLIFCNIGQNHGFTSTGEMTIVNCLLKPGFLSGELMNSENALEILALASFQDFNGNLERFTPKISFRGIDLVEVETLVEMMQKEFREKAAGYKTALKGYMSVLLTRIFREMRREDMGQILQHVNRISPDILKYIESNCFERITLKELAHKCFYNPSYFSRVFRECYGQTLTDYIHERRVQEAVRMLQETDLSVDAVCRSVGYKEKKQFYKVFKKCMGVTPSTIRQSAAKQTKPGVNGHEG